ncbi:hypothetical protein AHAS_Ahas15G0307100 [Arachis hypogaea]
MKILAENDRKKFTEPKLSYKESLLATPGSMDKDNDFLNETITEGESDPDNRWYKNDEDLSKREKPFDPCPDIKVSKEEFEKWCKPMLLSLLKSLGKESI